MWTYNNQEWVTLCVLEDAQPRTIRVCKFSPCGTFLAAASFDATVTIWAQNTNNKECEWSLVSTLEGQDNECKGVAWSNSGGLLASCSRDKSIWMWDMHTDDEYDCEAVLIGHDQDVKSVHFVPGIKEDVLVSTSYDDSIRVWVCSLLLVCLI